MTTPNDKSVTVKFSDGQIMIFRYQGDIQTFLSNLHSYSGDTNIYEWVCSEDHPMEEVEDFMYDGTHFLLKYSPVNKNKGYKIMIGKYWKVPDNPILERITERVQTAIDNKEFAIFKKKPNYHKNTFELQIIDLEK